MHAQELLQVYIIKKVTRHVVCINYCMLLCYDDEVYVFPSAQSIVQDVIQRGVAQGGQVERSSDDHWLKVCGRDEYLDP